MKKKIDISFLLKSIEVIEVGLTPANPPVPQTNTYQYNINSEHRIFEDKKMLHNIVSVGIYGEDKSFQLGHLKIAYSFEIDNFEDFLKETQANIKIPDEMLSLFNAITISTTRGIMFAQFRGTFLHNAILPIIDPASFKKEN